MPDLIAVLTSDNGSWNHVKKLIDDGSFERAFLICTTSSKSMITFSSQTKVEWVEIDSSKPIQEIIAKIIKALESKVRFSEIGLNFASGNGKEHMAVLSAIMRLGVGFRLIAATKEGVSEI